MSIPIFVGFDPREAAGYHVFCQSVLAHTKEEVSFTPMRGQQGDATNAFSYERWSIPARMGFRGWALYAECDMLCRAPLEDLWARCDGNFDVMVAPHDYKTKHAVKYWGQPNLDYPRKNQSSLMLINCNAAVWQRLHETRAKMTGEELHRFSLFNEERVGRIPLAWNWLAGEYNHNPDAQLVHFTLGIPPLFDYSVEAIGYVAEWWRTYSAVTRTSEKA